MNDIHRNKSDLKTNNKFSQPLNEVVRWGHVTNYFTFLHESNYSKYLHLQKTHGHQTRQGADLQWEVPILKATWFFDQVTNVK